MTWVGYALVSMSVVYGATVVWLWLRARRTSFLRYSSVAVAGTALYAFSAGMVYIRAAQGQDYDFYYRACWIGWVPMCSVIGLCYDVRGKPRVGAWIERIGGALWLGILALCLATDWVEQGAHSLSPFVDRAGPLELPFRGLGVLFLIWGLTELVRTHRVTSGLDRQRTSYFLIGIGSYALLGLFGGGIGQLAGVGFDPALTVAFSVPWIAITLYAVSRHRLFDVRIVLSRILTAIAITTIATAVMWLLFVGLSGSLSTHVAAAVAAAGTAILTTATPLTGAVLRTAQNITGESTRTWTVPNFLATTLSLNDLPPHIANVPMSQLGSSGATLYLATRGGGLRRAHVAGDRPGDSPRHLAPESPITRWARDTPHILSRDAQAHDAQIVTLLDSLSCDVLVPIVYDEELVSLLVLAGKRNRDAYTEADEEHLRLLGAQAGVAIGNAQLFSEVAEARADLSALVNAAAHDLRSPLNGIDLLAQFIVDDLHDPDATRAHLTTMRERVARLQRLLDAVEDYVRAGRDDDRMDRQPLEAVVHKAVERVTKSAQTHIEIEIDAEPTLLVETTLGEVVRNLVDNAITHHDADAHHIRVHVGHAGVHLEVDVSDDGPGIEQAHHERIFGMLTTLERRDVREGAGMGLAVCRRLVHRAGGQIEVQSREPRGSTFRFTWPAGVSSAPTRASRTSTRTVR